MIDIAEFLSVCVYLSERAGDIIRDVHASGQKQENMKIDGPVTIADIRAQKTIQHNLNALYPSLVIKGEESDKRTSQVESDIKPEMLTKEVREMVSGKDLL